MGIFWKDIALNRPYFVMKQIICYGLVLFSLFQVIKSEEVQVEEVKNSNRLSKLLPVFQVVRFPNDPCEISAGSKNGTCYTAEECSNKGGTNGGTCASGFGVCCIFTIGCGATSSENCTYFEVTGAVAGACRSRICKQTNICQIRLDFDTFIITGPVTTSLSIAKATGGMAAPTAKTAMSHKTTCATDQFSVSNAPNVPTVCGTLTGDHIYFDTIETCHSLNFNFGTTAYGTTIPSTRQFSIKVTQISCNDQNKAPNGCLQWHYGSSGIGYIKTFNYGEGIHLALQKQVMCIRREVGYCRVCFSADNVANVDLSGKADAGGVVKGESCCAYGTKGTKTTGVYDCLMIPAATKTGGGNTPSAICGGNGGIVTAAGTTGKTVCSKAVPFRMEFYSDGYEVASDDAEDDANTTKGLYVKYFQTTC